MKRIEIDDEMYNSLIHLATEMSSQNPRGTRMPHIFQIRDWRRVYDDNLNGDVRVFIDSSDGWTVIETIDELRHYISSEDVIEPDNLDEMWECDYHWDLDEWVEENLPKLSKSTYSMEPIYINAFLTAKAAQSHLDSNNYHYHPNADVYLHHAWRNPEAELVSKFLMGLIGKELHT
jgi:hypothetical protein